MQIAPVLVAAVRVAPFVAWKYLISKAFTLFCRKFGNVVNRAFLVLILRVKKLVGANFYAFCNYGQNLTLLEAGLPWTCQNGIDC